MSKPPSDDRPRLVRPDPRDQADVCAATRDAEQGDELVTMTAGEFERWMATGEGGPWPGSSGSTPGI